MNFEGIIRTINEGTVFDRAAIKLAIQRPTRDSFSERLRAYIIPARVVPTRGYISYVCIHELELTSNLLQPHMNSAETVRYNSPTSPLTISRQAVLGLIDKEFDWQLTYQKPALRVQHGLCVEVDKYDLQKLNQTLVPKFNCTSKLCIAVHDAVRGKLSGSPLDPTTYQPANITGSKPFDPFDL